MAAQFVTHGEFDEHKQFVSKYLDNIDRRLNTMETTQSHHSVRLSGIETRLETLQLEMASRFAQVDARFLQADARMTQLETKMDAQFAKIDVQMKEIRHMLGFLITHMGLILPPMPES